MNILAAFAWGAVVLLFAAWWWGRQSSLREVDAKSCVVEKEL